MVFRMFRSAILAAVLMTGCISSHSAFAQADTKEARLAAARAYISLTTNEDALRQTVAGTLEPLLDQIKARQPGLYAQKEAELRKLLENTMLQAARDANTGADERMADIFTLGEIRALQIFARSTTGKSVLKKLPRYSAAMAGPMQQAIISQMRTLQTELRKMGFR